ncbi:MAG: hypothetical protein J0I12_32530 [Candidatus Eremiobacteraeota bacterium]|nr:hypothetical protein [Candidatus Eremiobacteraeota bacterium]
MSKFFAHDIEMEFPMETGAFAVRFQENLTHPEAMHFKMAAGFLDHPGDAYILTGPQDDTHHGGIRTMKLDHKSLHLSLSQAAAQTLQTGPEIEIEFFPLGEHEFTTLERGLQRILSISATPFQVHQAGYQGPVIWQIDQD